jgi:hypothetical protein
MLLSARYKPSSSIRELAGQIPLFQEGLVEIDSLGENVAFAASEL